MGWDRAELARRLEISVSRLADYELGHTRGKNPQKAPIPRLVELACAYQREAVSAPTLLFSDGKVRVVHPLRCAAGKRALDALAACQQHDANQK